ncbi:MAG: hypothetical protein M3N24_01810 [Actinomycetota bacterium]|nr:hypothetical protein [Actinomycetota bacterium]
MALGSLSAGAALIHFAVAPEHFREEFRFGLFFVLVATFQLVWGAAILRGESRALHAAGAVGNAVVLGVWAVSRTTGLPVGPDAWTPEPIASIDGLATAYEAGVVAGSLYSFGALSGLRDRWAPVRVGRRSAVVVYLLPALAFLFGGHGHGLGGGGHLDVHLGHHFFHLIFFGAASVVFAFYVAFLVWENGWPTFSWRLDPDAPDR